MYMYIFFELRSFSFPRFIVVRFGLFLIFNDETVGRFWAIYIILFRPKFEFIRKNCLACLFWLMLRPLVIFSINEEFNVIQCTG